MHWRGSNSPQCFKAVESFQCGRCRCHRSAISNILAVFWSELGTDWSSSIDNSDGDDRDDDDNDYDDDDDDDDDNYDDGNKKERVWVRRRHPGTHKPLTHDPSLKMMTKMMMTMVMMIGMRRKRRMVVMRWFH